MAWIPTRQRTLAPSRKSVEDQISVLINVRVTSTGTLKDAINVCYIDHNCFELTGIEYVIKPRQYVIKPTTLPADLRPHGAPESSTCFVCGGDLVGLVPLTRYS